MQNPYERAAFNEIKPVDVEILTIIRSGCQATQLSQKSS
jgi:hypothetical protein